jgi:AraC-like DNA-binding protein
MAAADGLFINTEINGPGGDTAEAFELLGPAVLAAARHLEKRQEGEPSVDHAAERNRWRESRVQMLSMRNSTWIRPCLAGSGKASATETVADVAFSLGLTDVGNFSRIFKQAFGVTPSSVLAASRRSEPVTCARLSS